MMYIFSTGEKLYHKHTKKLKEGLLIAESISYDTIDQTTVFLVKGTIDEKPANLRFSLIAEHLEDIKAKSVYKILMQSDILGSDWAGYEIDFSR